MIRLKDFQNIDIIKATKKQITAKVSNNPSHGVPKIQWVAENYSLPLELRTINELYENYGEERLNPNSMTISSGYIEKNAQALDKFEVLQLERKGLACVQEKDKNKKIILNLT